MTSKTSLDNLLSNPSNIQFKDVLALIARTLEEQNRSFKPTAFTNGELNNAAGENNGSCQVFAFAKQAELEQQQTLALFGEHYRSVMDNPNGSDHQNIRNFQQHGWPGIQFESNPFV